MPYTGWLEYAGVELINDARVGAYAASHGIASVQVDDADGLTDYLHTTYTDPATDRPPWWDPSRPGASASFCGVLGISFTGVDASPVEATVTNATGDGGSASPAVAGPREINATAILIANDRGGADLGLSWLGAALRGRPPVGRASALPNTLPPRYGTPPRAGGLAPALRFLGADPALANPGDVRTLYDVSFTGDLAVSGWTPLSGGDGTHPNPIAVELTFTLTACSPWIWRPAVQLAATPLAAYPTPYNTAGSPWSPGSSNPINWIMSRNMSAPFVPRGEDPATAVCAGGSGCPPMLTIPRPFPDLDWCSATTPMVPRYGPLADVADAPLSPALEYTPIVIIEPGAGLMRRVSIRVGRRLPGGYHDPSGLALTHELNVPYLPASTRCILDGRTGTAIVDCAYVGTVADAVDGPPPKVQFEPAAYGIRASPLIYPTFAGSEDLRFTAHAEDGYAHSSARVYLFVAARQALA